MIPIKRELFVLNRNKWDHLTECTKINLDSYENAIDKMCLEIIYLIYMYWPSG